MSTFILKRLALAVPTVIVITFVVFFISRLAPSSPIDIILGEKANPETRHRLEHAYGLDLPIMTQYLRYVSNILLHGDFGRSFTRGQQPVADLIRTNFPVTAQLAVSSLLLAMLIGLPVGVLAALYHNSWFDRLAMAFVVAMVSIPNIVLGPVMVLFLAVKLRLLPVSGWEMLDIQLFGSALHLSVVDPRYVIMPAIALGSRSAAIIARFMRASLLDVLRQDYMRTAMAKGLSRARAVWKHAIKNSLLPVLTVIGTSFGFLLTGSFVVETIFQVPGIGYESINSILARDYPVIQGMTLLVAVIFILVNLLVDILYGVVDPRVRSQEARA